jgi:hypothetical protein
MMRAALGFGRRPRRERSACIGRILVERAAPAGTKRLWPGESCVSCYFRDSTLDQEAAWIAGAMLNEPMLDLRGKLARKVFRLHDHRANTGDKEIVSKHRRNGH